MDNTPRPGGLLQQHALPTPVTDLPLLPPTQTGPVPKHFLAAFFLSFFLGVFGADRFYLGYYVSGALKLLTFGWFGIGAIVDLALIMNGAMTDSRNRPLAGYPEYKATAKRTVLWITIGGCVIGAVSIIITIISFQQMLSSSVLSNFTNPTAGGTSSQSLQQTLNSLNSL